MEVDRGEKMQGYVTRRGKSERGIGVEVTLEVGSAWVKTVVKFVKMVVESREKMVG